VVLSRSITTVWVCYHQLNVQRKLDRKANQNQISILSSLIGLGKIEIIKKAGRLSMRIVFNAEFKVNFVESTTRGDTVKKSLLFRQKSNYSVWGMLPENATWKIYQRL
jgi:hypothetical protein